MRDATAHGLMFALGAAAAIVALLMSRRSSTAAAGDASSSYSWLSSSGSAENIFGKPYATTSGKRDEDVKL